MVAGENAAGGKDLYDSVFPRRHVSFYLKSVSWEACDGRRWIMGMSVNVSISSNACCSGYYRLIIGIGNEGKVFGAEMSSNGFSNGWGTQMGARGSC